MLMQQHKLRWHYRHWFLTEKRKHYGRLVSRTWPRVKSQIPIEWYTMWQAVYCNYCSQGASRQIQEDFDAEVTFFTQYIDKRSPTSSVKFASVGQNRAAKRQKASAGHGTFKGKIELKKYIPERNTTRSWWHSISSYTSSRRWSDSLRVRRTQKPAEL